MITMPLKQLLRFLLIIVNHTRVSSTIENLRTCVCCQVVNTLINVLVKTEHPLEIQSRHSVSLLVLRHLLAIVTVLHI